MNKMSFVFSKRFIVAVTFAFISTLVFCQRRDRFLVDAKYEVSWTLNFINDTVEMTQGPEDIFILQTGADYAYQYSHIYHFRDSMFMLNINPAEIIGELIKSNRQWGSDLFRARLFKDYKSKKITVVDKISNHWFIYEEELLPQNWTILHDTATIAGYKCQKAICDYRGRSYHAWFTTEIPISEGPWKFFGLPGLIVKLHDTEHHYEFELAGFRETDTKINIQPVLRGRTTYFLHPTINTTTVRPRRIERIEFLKLMYGNQLYDIAADRAATAGIQLAPREIKFDHLERDYK